MELPLKSNTINALAYAQGRFLFIDKFTIYMFTIALDRVVFSLKIVYIPIPCMD